MNIGRPDRAPIVLSGSLACGVNGYAASCVIELDWRCIAGWPIICQSNSAAGFMR